MTQAAWNLCPQQTAYSADCYFQDDIKFDAISGAVHTTLADVPDGVWSLQLKRDMMGKVGGAVRVSDRVVRAALWTKVRRRQERASQGLCRGRGGCQTDRRLLAQV